MTVESLEEPEVETTRTEPAVATTLHNKRIWLQQHAIYIVTGLQQLPRLHEETKEHRGRNSLEGLDVHNLAGIAGCCERSWGALCGTAVAAGAVHVDRRNRGNEGKQNTGNNGLGHSIALEFTGSEILGCRRQAFL